MKLDLGTMLGQAEDFLRRHVKSRAVREAEKRQRQRRAERRERRIEEAARRIARAGIVTGASGAAVLGYTMAVAPVGAIGLIAAGGATFAAAAAALLWPTRWQSDTQARIADLDLLPWHVEEWLLERREQLPTRTHPALDAILLRLHDIQPFLAGLDPDGALAGDIRRLIGGHLPRLVDTYRELPATTVERRPEVVKTLVASLGTVAEELARLCEEASRGHMLTFETQGRFIEDRYRSRSPFGGG